MTRFLKLNRTNNPANPDEDETVFVNLAELKYFIARPKGGATVHLVHEDLPWHVRESCEDLVLQHLVVQLREDDLEGREVQ